MDNASAESVGYCSLHSLTETVRDKVSRTRLSASLPIAHQRDIEFPVLPDSPNEKSVRLLQAAAEVEHELMVQYLYAGGQYHSRYRASPHRTVKCTCSLRARMTSCSRTGSGRSIVKRATYQEIRDTISEMKPRSRCQQRSDRGCRNVIDSRESVLIA